MASIYYILNSVGQSLINAGLFQESNCFYAFSPKDTTFPPSDNYCVIQPHSVDVKDRTWATTHKPAYIWKVDFSIWLFVRLGTDEANRDQNYLLDPSYGSIVLVDSVINNLQSFVMTDGGNVFGVLLDRVEFQIENRQSIAWGYTKLKYHTDFNRKG